jgi:predicted nuclease of predicted toxin-antitoxin system
MRVLLDENIHRGLLSFLTSLGHDAQLSPKGLSNGKVLALAVSENRILVTHDEDFAKRLFPSHHPGIMLVKIPSRRFEPLKQATTKLLAQRASTEQFRDKLTILFEDRFDQIPFAFEDIPF